MKRFILSAALLAANAAAFGAQGEYLVRFNQALDSTRAAQAELSQIGASFAGLKIEVINGAEGLVKVSLPKGLPSAALDRAVQMLERAPNVANVSMNHLYRPAIRYSIKESVQAATQDVDFLGLPWADFWNTRRSRERADGIPAVQLPSSPIIPGADPKNAEDWAMHKIGLEGVENLNAQGSITAAVIDTGVDYNHEDLIDAMWRKEGNATEVGYDFAHNTATPYDVKYMDFEGCGVSVGCLGGTEQHNFLVNPGHGTHCAGHVAAVANNSKGIRGVGAGTKVMALKFFFDHGDENAGSGDDAGAVKAIDYAIANGAKVISASWGGEMPRSEADKSEIKAAIARARDAGILFVVAAGNGNAQGQGYDLDTAESPVYPAAYTDLDNLIVVAAMDENDALGTFSNYGVKTAHIGAPGVKVLSTTVGSEYSDVVGTLQVGGPVLGPILGLPSVTVNWDGTSMATPIVAGAVSLVWSQHPNENYHQIKDRILRSARPVAALQGKVSSGGVLNVAGALAN